MDAYTLSHVYFSGLATQIGGVTNRSATYNVDVTKLGQDGLTEPRIVFANSASPVISVATHQIATALTTLTDYGRLISGDNETHVFFRKKSPGAGNLAGSVNIKGVMTHAHVVPQSLSANQGGVATLNFDILALDDGAAAQPIVWSASNALAGDAGSTEAFTVGKLDLLGTDYELQSIDWDFGLGTSSLSSDGGIFPKTSHYNTNTPSFRFTSYDMSLLTVIGNSGTAQVTTDSVIYLRKKAAGAGNVADATEEHISITVASGMWVIDSHAASQGGESLITFSLHANDNNSDDFLTIDTTAAIV